MLANIEDRMYIDQYGSLDSMTLEEQKKKLRAKIEQKTLEKPKNIPNFVISSPDETSNGDLSENDSEDDYFDEVDSSKPVSGIIVLNVDGFVRKIVFWSYLRINHCHL